MVLRIGHKLKLNAGEHRAVAMVSSADTCATSK